MNASLARDTILGLLADIAPEADLSRLAEATGVDVPENDYPDVRTLAGLSTYVERHT